MPGRDYPDNPLDIVIKRAAMAAQGRYSPSQGSGAGGGTTGAITGAAGAVGSITTAGTNGDGNVITVHPFILDIDALDDPGSVLSYR